MICFDVRSLRHPDPLRSLPQRGHPNRPPLRRQLCGTHSAWLIAGLAVFGCGDNSDPSDASGAGGADLGSGGVTLGSGGFLADATGGAESTGGAASGGVSGGGDAAGGALASGGSPGGGVGTGGGATGGTGSVSAEFVVDVQLASELDPAAPTTVGIVTWSLPGTTPDSAKIQFGPDESYGMEAPVDLGAEGYRTLLLGMKPQSTYHFRIVCSSANGELTSEDFTIETKEDQSGVKLQSFDIKNEMARERGFLVTSFWRGDGSSMIFILDADGDVVWWNDTGMMGVARARMSADGKNMWMTSPNNQGSPIQRVTLDGLEAETYSGVIGSHDLTPVSGETMAFLEYGESDCDSIYEIDPSGVTKEIWESADVASGMCHGNALRYSKTEDAYTFSDVSTDVWVIGRDGQFLWGLADKVDGGVNAWGGTNHGHHLLENSMIIFANRGASSMGSTVVEYDLEGNEIFNYDGGAFSANLGDVQRLPGGNTLVTYSNDGIIHEITADKEVVLEVHAAGQSFGYALWRDSLYGEPSDLGL